MLAVLSVFFGQAGWAWGTRPVAPPPRYAPGQVLVAFHPGVSSERTEAIVAFEECRILKGVREGVFLLALPPGRSVEEAVHRFTVYREVRYAEPNYIVERVEGAIP